MTSTTPTPTATDIARPARSRWRRRLRWLLPAAVLVTLLSGGAVAALETDTVGSLGEGIWWALSLITTVGFVGATPVTTAGRVLAGVLMVLGFALLSLLTASMASLFVREDEAPAEQREAHFESLVLAELRALSERLERLERALPSDAPDVSGGSRYRTGSAPPARVPAVAPPSAGRRAASQRDRG
jgi:hypothetical protein